MERARFIEMLKNMLRSIEEPRFFDTERGYQGALLAELQQQLAMHPIWPGEPVVEQEYQKRAGEYGLRLRPDIIVHIPFDRRTLQNRRQGNYAVLQLKLRGNLGDALNDYCKLALMCTVLNYGLGVFINIDSESTYFDDYKGDARDKLYAFAVQLRDRHVSIYESGDV